MGFPLAQISDHADVFNGKTPAKSEQREVGSPILKIRDVDENGIFRGSFESFVDEDFYNRFEKKKIKQGDTLILNAAHNADYVGSKSFLAKSDVDGVIATGEWLTVRPNSTTLDARYAHFWLTSRQARKAIRDLVKGIHLYPKDVARLEIPLPPLEEQKRIAAILDQADNIRRKRQHAIDRLYQLGQAIFHEMFESSDSSAWPIADLADVVRDGTIVTYGIVQAGDEYPGGIPYIRTGDIKDGQIVTTGLRHTSPEIASKFERSRVREGEIVMSIRATVGTVAFVPPALDGANLTQGTARISPGDRTNPKYLIEFFKSPSVQNWIAKQVKGATFREITLSRLRELPVRIPPMDLQSRFSSMMTQIDEQKQAHAQASALAELAFASLQHRAFTGQL